MINDLKPETDMDVCDAIADALRDGTALAVAGGGSKAGVGRRRDHVRQLDMRGFSGVVDYDPAELVLTVRAGTLLSEVEALVAGQGQRLAFAPFDHGPLFGRPAGPSTIGGVIAAGVAGSYRVSQGSARDHLLGFKGVSGRGESFFSGAKVVKNVTGYDLSKLVTGSWGRLVALTEVTLKVLPRPRVSVTKAVENLKPDEAVNCMSRALGSQAEVAAAAHIPAPPSGGASMTLLKIEGFEPSVRARCDMLDVLLADLGDMRVLPGEAAGRLWSELQSLASLGRDAPLWRINVAPSQASGIVAALDPVGAKWLFDWGGGLIWTTFGGDPAFIRAAAATAGGHATLIRAPDALRDHVPAFHPPVPGIAALETRVRRAFDPHGVFETGRF